MTTSFRGVLLLLLVVGTGCIRGNGPHSPSVQTHGSEARPARGAPAGEKARRVAWTSAPRNAEEKARILSAARELQFNTLIVKMGARELQAFAQEARSNGIEVLYWHSVECSDNEPLSQVMTAEDEAQYAAQKKWAKPEEHQYQWGGEPVTGRNEVLFMRLRCPHRKETLNWARQDIAGVLTNCPDVAGVALDYYGYQNYRNCRCAESERKLAAYRAQHPAMGEEDARAAFSADSLAAAINEVCNYVRELKPGARTAIHVYPTFLPEPLFGKRLDLDYCCQSVAWYFPPYWSDDKITRYAGRVVKEQNEHYSRQRGIPFVGVKPAERFSAEVRVVRAATQSDTLGVFNFNDIAASAELRQALKPDPPADVTGAPRLPVPGGL